MKTKKTKKLKTTLFLIPTIITVVSFAILSMVFDFAIRYHVRQIVEEKTMRLLADFDDFYKNPDVVIPYKEVQEEEDFIVLVKYLIMNENGDLVFPDKEWNLPKEREEAKNIAYYFKEKNHQLENKKMIEITIDKKRFALQAMTYQGEYDGYFIMPKENYDAENYTVIAYTNITAIKDFLNLLRKIWIILMIGTGVFTVLALLLMARRIDYSLAELKKYLRLIGKRQPIEKPKSLDYEEFNEVMSVVQDMSKMIDQSEETEKQFFQNASHELRTPLMSIQGYAEGIREGVIPQDKALDIIIKESERMATLINEMLFMSRNIETKPQKTKINLSLLLQQCVTEIEGIASKKDICFKVDIEPNIIINGEETRLNRAFTNILSNAVRYAKKKIEILCKIRKQEIVVWITDDGKGILPEDLPHIFERFYKGKDGNFGIGLSLTKEMIQQHDGKIMVESGNGNTVFTVIFPYSK